MPVETLRAPAAPAGSAPARRPGSIRRTSSIDTDWPQGLGEPMHMHGIARDLLTRANGSPPVQVALDEIDILATARREILTIRASRRNDIAQRLVGARGGGYLRAQLAQLMPDEVAGATPLNLLLDDYAGASLVAGWAWSRWRPDWLTEIRARGANTAGNAGVMIGICSGFREGSSALLADGTSDPAIQSSAVVPPLESADDPIGWHTLAPQEGVGMRRARRIDVWLDDIVHIDVGFQDSSTAPDGGDRIAVHEYRVVATATPDTLELLSVSADPRVLPYGECPAASLNVARMVGTRLAELRLAVPEVLAGTLGCTHLNDVLRSMSDVPQLAATLSRSLAVAAA